MRKLIPLCLLLLSGCSDLERPSAQTARFRVQFIFNSHVYDLESDKVELGPAYVRYHLATGWRTVYGPCIVTERDP